MAFTGKDGEDLPDMKILVCVMGRGLHQNCMSHCGPVGAGILGWDHLLQVEEGEKPRIMSSLETLLLAHGFANIAASHLQAKRANGLSLS